MQNSGYETDSEETENDSNFTEISIESKEGEKNEFEQKESTGKVNDGTKKHLQNNESCGSSQVSIIPQLIAAVGVNLGAFSFGTVACWSATGVPDLKNDLEFSEEITLSTSAWITSIITLGAFAASVGPIAFTMDKFGRRKALLLFSVLFTIAWLLMYFAHSITMILIGRFLTGFSGVIFFITAPIYLAEICEPRIRGMMITILNTMACVGILFVLVIGVYLSWRNQVIVCATFPIMAIGILIVVPESPRYLLSKGLLNEATKSLCWFRGISKDSQLLTQEIQELNRSIKENEVDSKGNVIKEMFQPHIRKAIMIGFMLFLFQTLTGMIAIMFYRIEIFQLANVDLDESTSSIIVGILHTLCSACSAGVVDRFGRKVLMITSEILVAVSLGGLGIFFHIQKQSTFYAQQYLNWLPLASLILFVGSYTSGMGGIPFSVIPEILPQRVRGLASSLLTACRWLMFFLLSRYFQDFMRELGPDIGYFTLAACCLVGAAYILFFVPETKGKSLEQIQRGFLRKSS